MREGSQDSALDNSPEPLNSKPAECETDISLGQRPNAAQPMLTTAPEIGERLQQMSDMFFASFDDLSNRRKKKERDGSTGSSTARAPSSGPSTIGRRTLDPLSFTPREAQLERRSSSRNASVDVGIPAAYVRPRLASTGSAASNMSIASGEVLGRMDPEIDDERRRSRSGRDWTG